MSNESAASSSNSLNVERIVYGIPNMCWCGAAINCNVSKSARNPYRRYYRCSYASNLKLANDKHTFKWCDEAVLNELERVRGSIEVINQLQLRLESEIYEKIDAAVLGNERKMKKVMVIGFVLIALIMIGAMKVLK